MDAPVAHRSRPRILIVEDDAALRSLLAEQLRQRGCDVIETATASEALDHMVRSLAPERADDGLALIVSDVRLRSHNGLGVAEVMRSLGHVAPVLLITAFPGPEIQARAAAIRDCRLLAKPFDLFVFFDVVLEMIGRQTRRDTKRAN